MFRQIRRDLYLLCAAMQLFFGASSLARASSPADSSQNLEAQLNDQRKKIEHLYEEVRQLQAELKKDRNAVAVKYAPTATPTPSLRLNQPYLAAGVVSAKPPSNSAPSNTVPGLTNLGYTDIVCRPKLNIGPPSYSLTPIGDGYYNIISAGTPGEVPKPRRGAALFPDGSDDRGDCRPLSPLTRLITENSDFIATGGYSNSVGVANALLPSNQLITTATTNFAVGIGYSKKPILKQLRALFYGSDSREAIAWQGTFWEEFFWNAITMDASYSWGRQLQVKAGIATSSYNTRPFYSISGTYTLDIERLYIYAKNIGAGTRTVRPADYGTDQGWYFKVNEPSNNPFYKDPAKDDPYRESLGWPRSEDYNQWW